MRPEEFAQLLDDVSTTLSGLVGRDWSQQAGALEWTCRETVDHMIDCVFSYAVQVAARAQSGFLPLEELHADAEATNRDLISGLSAVGRIFHAVVCAAPPGVTASDGVLTLDVGDWCARAAYELALHTFDVVSGLDVRWELGADLCRSVTASPQLWMFDPISTPVVDEPWIRLLVGSGRCAPL